MKYLIIQPADKLPVAVLFSEALEHADEAQGRKVLGAGFCKITGIENGDCQVQLWGDSNSLGIGRGRLDEVLVKMAVNFTTWSELEKERK
jgi:hypothetical protein